MVNFLIENFYLQYDFPKQEAVIQFVIEAIQAEAFNPKTLFLIGSYTIGRFCYSPSILELVFIPLTHTVSFFSLYGLNETLFSLGAIFSFQFFEKERKGCFWRLLVCSIRRFMSTWQNSVF
jgi:hypothetical protein